MARSGGVIFSAVLVFLGSTFAVLTGALIVVAGLIAPRSSSEVATPIDFNYFAAIEAAVFFGFGAWGIASGIGLMRIKPWARISMLAFACLLLVGSVSAGVMVAVTRMPVPNDPIFPASFMLMTRALVVGFYVLLAGLAVFWLYFFNRKIVKAQFLGAAQILRS